MKNMSHEGCFNIKSDMNIKQSHVSTKQHRCFSILYGAPDPRFFFCQSFSVLNSSWVPRASVPPSDSCINNEGGREQFISVCQRPDGGIRPRRIMSPDRCHLLTNRNLSAVRLNHQSYDIDRHSTEMRGNIFFFCVSKWTLSFLLHPSGAFWCCWYYLLCSFQIIQFDVVNTLVLYCWQE